MHKGLTPESAFNSVLNKKPRLRVGLFSFVS